MLTSVPGLEGWVNDGCGVIRRQEPWESLTGPPQVRTAPAGLDPMIRPVTIRGAWPTAAQLAIVDAELRKAPPSIVAALRARGVRIEVVAGRNAGVHPEVPWRCGGMCSGSLIVLAGEVARHATLHEVGHCHDDVRLRGGRFSSLPEWEAIHATLPPEVFANDFFNGDRHHRSNPAESFAEIFGKCYHGPLNRAEVPGVARRFIAWSIGK